MDTLELKAVRKVRTPAGVAKFGQPIGSIIVRDGEAPLSHITVEPSDYSGVTKVRGTSGEGFYVLKDEDEGGWVALNEDEQWDDYAVRWAKNEEEVLRLLDRAVQEGRRPGDPAKYGGLHQHDSEAVEKQVEENNQSRINALRKYTDRRRKTYNRTIAGYVKNAEESISAGRHDEAREWIEKADEVDRSLHRKAQVEEEVRVQRQKQEEAERHAAKNRDIPLTADSPERTLRQLNDGDVVELWHQGKPFKGVIRKHGRNYFISDGEQRFELGGGNSRYKYSRVRHAPKPGSAEAKDEAKAREELGLIEQGHQSRIDALAAVIAQDPAKYAGTQANIDKYLAVAQSLDDDADPVYNLRKLKQAEDYLRQAEAREDAESRAHFVQKKPQPVAKAPGKKMRIGKIDVDVLSRTEDRAGIELVVRRGSVEYTINIPKPQASFATQVTVKNNVTGQTTTAQQPSRLGAQSSKEMLDARMKAVDEAFTKLRKRSAQPVIERRKYDEYMGINTLLMNDTQKQTLARVVDSLNKGFVRKAEINLEWLRKQVANDGGRTGIVGKLKALQKEIDALAKGDNE